jgi:hypothetical protein
LRYVVVAALIIKCAKLLYEGNRNHYGEKQLATR